MRVLFYDCGYESFGVQYLIAMLKEYGHEVRLFFDSSFAQDYLAQDFPLTGFFSLKPEGVCTGILAEDPDVVCFSVYTLFYRQNLAIIRLLKKARPNLIVVCGGFHSSLLPSVVLENPEIDFVILGEADISLPALLGRLAALPVAQVKTLPPGALPGVWNCADGTLVERGLSPIPDDLDALPFPEKAMYYRENPSLSTIYTIIASRGCPYGCTYCNSATMNQLYKQHGQRYYRVRSVESVLAELQEAVEQYKPRFVMFFDDVFAANRKWLQEFARRYKAEIGLPYYCQTSPLIHDEESLALLADSGCCLLEFGFQSANARVRQEVLNRRETNGNVKKLVTHAISLGIFTELDLIANLPGETQDHIQEALDFVSETRPHWVNLAFLQFHPRTPITEIALRANMLTEADIKRIEQGEHATSMRLLSKANLGRTYRILSFQMFAAFWLPQKISSKVSRWVERPLLGSLCALFASSFLYASRILLSFTDKRDFLVRHHVIRCLYAAKWVVARKVFGYARH
jgi:anaerobic magnesium-protoporphyrin IX monomethyl ester cyclase